MRIRLMLLVIIPTYHRRQHTQDTHNDPITTTADNMISPENIAGNCMRSVE